MRGLYAAVAILAAVGCKSDEDDTDTVGATCDDYQTVALPELESTEWPAGLADALPAYQSLDGRWSVTDCNDASVQFEAVITAPPQEQLQVITSGVPADVACGCLEDPLYDHDNTMTPVAFIPQLEVFMESQIDPGVDLRAMDFTGTLFAGTNGDLLVRACTTRSIDPADGSDYDEAWLTLRVDKEGALSMSVLLGVLGENANPATCELDTWAFIGD